MKCINLNEDNRVLFNVCKSKAIKENPKMSKTDDNSIIEKIFKKYLGEYKNGK
jgi:hypothetical protein